ncbi:MAG: tryptophan synthase subunit alpha [Pseudomonadales bacterium]|nr:tryptophan synthase subunit alpha [Pseudomonadales bacterium]NRA14193.1 tryptophan synthase subunit alpha [Oceanospirillaceae bacterium]
MNTLAKFIKEQRQTKPILLMTHVIYGYPSIDESLQMMKTLLEKGASILEVQFPFSDPVADGPVITNACHQALQSQPKLQQCLKDISALGAAFPNSKVLLMSYLNPLLQYGFKQLAEDMSPHVGGVIIPDLPIDHHKMLEPLLQAAVDPIWLIIPGMDKERIELVCEHARGLLYCVSRKGVTGQGVASQSAHQQLQQYLGEINQHTAVPLALGFGIASAADVREITGLVDVAVVGSALLRAHQSAGLSGFSQKADELLSATN